MNKEKRLWFCLVLAAGCAVLFGGCEAITSLFGGDDTPVEVPDLFDPDAYVSFYVKAGGTDDTSQEGAGSMEKPFATLQYAYDQAVANGAIQRIVALSDLKADAQVVFGNGKTLVIEGRWPYYTITRSTQGVNNEKDINEISVLEISGNAKIEFVRIRVNGIYDDGETTANNRAIRVIGYIDDNGTTTVDVANVNNGKQDTTVVTLGAGAVLTGQTSNDSDRGGGISVDQGGKLVMLAGSEVSGCYSSIGGAVQVYNSVFDMQGGLITENNAENGGGVYADGGSAFTMSDGEISYNTAERFGGGVYLWKWDPVKSKTPKFTMTGGKINNNTADKMGGGVCVNWSGIFELVGGEIIDNKVKGEHYGIGGGGIATLGDWTDPSVYAVITIKGGRISGNNAPGGGGGGVGVGSGTEFTMEGGEISGNSDNSNDKPAAGGVFLLDNSYTTFITFTMTGGVISGNTATGTATAKAAELYKGQDAVIKTGVGTTVTIGGVAETFDAGKGSKKKIDDPIEAITPE
jgi:hypothetical protein